NVCLGDRVDLPGTEQRRRIAPRQDQGEIAMLGLQELVGRAVGDLLPDRQEVEARAIPRGPSGACAASRCRGVVSPEELSTPRRIVGIGAEEVQRDAPGRAERRVQLGQLLDIGLDGPGALRGFRRGRTVSRPWPFRGWLAVAGLQFELPGLLGLRVRGL